MSEKGIIIPHFVYRKFVLTHKHFLPVQNLRNAVAFLYMAAGGEFRDSKTGRAIIDDLRSPNTLLRHQYCRSRKDRAGREGSRLERMRLSSTRALTLLFGGVVGAAW